MTPEDAGHLDLVLEELTAEILRLVDGEVTGEEIRVRTDGGWRLAAWLEPDTFAVDFVPEGDAQIDALDDYQLALIYGLGFEDEEQGERLFFRQAFDREEGEEWEEQAVRELALLGLGALRDVLRCAPISSYRVEGERSRA
ncbi:MAG: hypothetical protein ACM3S1_11280 [Hyphomicrobiales bacterium]